MEVGAYSQIFLLCSYLLLEEVTFIHIDHHHIKKFIAKEVKITIKEFIQVENNMVIIANK